MALDPNRYKPYDREYAKHDNAKQRLRMRARYAMVKKYGEAALKGKDIDHIHPLQAGGGNAPGNLRVRDASENRGDTKKIFKMKGYRPTRID